MIPLSRDGIKEGDIIDALHFRRGSRTERFSFNLLDKNNNFIRKLNNIEGGSIKHAAFSDIKRTAQFTLVDDGSINFLSDRIQPLYEILVSGVWVAYPLGVFLLASPKRADTENKVKREVEAYDGLMVLIDDKFEEPWTVTAGTNYKAAVITLLQSAGISKYILEDTSKVLSTSQVFDVGTTKLSGKPEL